MSAGSRMAAELRLTGRRRVEERLHVGLGGDTAAHRERREGHVGGTTHDVEHRLAPLVRRRDVEERDPSAPSSS